MNCLSLNFWRSNRKRIGLVFSFARAKRKRPGCSKLLEDQSEAKGISPTLSKLKIKLTGVFQKFAKTKQNEVKTVKIVQDRSKTNLFVSYWEEEEKWKKTKLRFFWKEAKENEYNRSSTIVKGNRKPYFQTGSSCRHKMAMRMMKQRKKERWTEKLQEIFQVLSILKRPNHQIDVWIEPN